VGRGPAELPATKYPAVFLKRFAMRYACLTIVAALLIGLVWVRPSAAVVQFYNVFKAEYLDKHQNQEFAAEVNKGTNKCYVCHQGKSRKHHNQFGKHLVEPLDRTKDTKNIEKIKAELAKVLEMKVNPQDEHSETYADRLKASKWPAGELEELKKEPPEEAVGN
jgi:hypothetical protein